MKLNSKSNSKTKSITPFGVQGLYSTIDKMKARYEYNDEEIQNLQKEYQEASELELNDTCLPLPVDYHRKPPPAGDARTPEAIQSYYVEARRDLTIQSIRRSLLLQARLGGLEDELLSILERMLLTYSKLRAEHINTADLARIARIIESTRNSNNIFQEAQAVPAQLDPDRAEQDMEADKKWVLEIIKAVKDDKEPQD